MWMNFHKKKEKKKKTNMILMLWTVAYLWYTWLYKCTNIFWTKKRKKNDIKNWLYELNHLNIHFLKELSYVKKAALCLKILKAFLAFHWTLLEYWVGSSWTDVFANLGSSNFGCAQTCLWPRTAHICAYKISKQLNLITT